MPTAASCAFLSCLAADAKLSGAMSSGPSFLQAHRATLTPEGQGWWLLYPVAALTVVDRDQESIDVRIPIAAGSYHDALEIVRLVLRLHKPPEATTHPAECTTQSDRHQHDTPARSSAYHVLGGRAASIHRHRIARLA
jgi:hypothetical protein